MHYISTRGDTTPRSFCDILLEGLAPDSGLYRPDNYPTVSLSELSKWRSLDYAQIAAQILHKFAPDIPYAVLQALTQKTYTADVYCHTRKGEPAEDITPFRVLEEYSGKYLVLQALSNGPTLSFKDMGLQLLGNLFEYLLTQNQAELNILGATSGDTGSSAEYAMRGKQGLRVFMLSPHQKMSRFQTSQMFSLQEPNIFNIAIQGVFDDCQDLVKAVSTDLAYKEKYKIGTVNSINWARIAAQVVYYFYAHSRITTQPEQRISFTVPSGNFGNVYAAHVARMMGLPIDKLVVATNENDVLDEFFHTGIYRIRNADNTQTTSSPSMDISKASNLERFIFDLLKGDTQRVRALFQKIETHKSFDLSGAPGSDGDEFLQMADYGFLSGKSTHRDRIKTIRYIQAACGIIVDPHTANGIKVAQEHIQPGVPMIVLETALPIKFNETIREAVARNAPIPENFKELEVLSHHFKLMPVNVEELKNFIATKTA